VPSPEHAYVFAAWSSWLLPLAAYEIIHLLQKDPTRRRASSQAGVEALAAIDGGPPAPLSPFGDGAAAPFQRFVNRPGNCPPTPARASRDSDAS
jgi:hypothetical protein